MDYKYTFTPKKKDQCLKWNLWQKDFELFKLDCGDTLTDFFKEEEAQKYLDPLNIVKLIKFYSNWAHEPNKNRIPYINEIIILCFIYAGIDVTINQHELDELVGKYFIEESYFNILKKE